MEQYFHEFRDSACITKILITKIIRSNGHVDITRDVDNYYTDG